MERTKDIGKIVKTISLENDEDIITYQHQCHLLQELNYATLKEIKILDQKIKETSNQIIVHNSVMQQISELKNQLEHDSLNKLRARLNNGISGEFISKLKLKLDD